MRQTLHIFQKDVRRLAWYIGAVLFLFAAFAWAHSHTGLAITNYILLSAVESFVPLLLPLTIWFAMVHVIQDEPLPGNCQFWITRPYSRWSLLAAKILFVIAFINLPLLASDAGILAMQHLPVPASFSALLLHQIFVSSWLIVPLFTLATITDTLARCGLYVILILTGIFFEAFLFTHPLNNLSTPKPGVALLLFVGLLSILATAVVRQYLSRQTRSNGLVSTLSIVFIGWPLLGFAAMPPSLQDVSGINERAPDLVLLPDKLELLGLPRARIFVLRIPVRITHLPSNAVVSANGDLTISSDRRVLWRSATYSDLSVGLIFSRDGQVSYLKAQIDAGLLKTIAAQPRTLKVDLHGSLLHGQTVARVPVTATDFAISGVGRCQTGPWMLRLTGAQKLRYPDQISFDCSTTFRWDDQIVYTVEENGVESDIQGNAPPGAFGSAGVTTGFAGLPVSAALDPVVKWTLHVALPPGLKGSQTAKIVFRKTGQFSLFDRVIVANNARFPSGL